MRRISALFACSIAFGVLTACSEGVKAPLAQVDAPPPSVNAGSYVLLNGSASQDPQGRPLSYAWSFIERPLGSNATLVDEHTATPSFLADVPGTYVLQLIVSNSVLTSTATEVRVQVSTCAANVPVITGALHASKNPLNIGEATQLTAFVTDADNESPCNLNQTLSYSWVLIQQPAGSTAALNSEKSETPSLIPDKSGDYMVRLTVTDSTGLSSEPKTLIVTVANCGAGTPSVAPTATPNPTHPNATVQLAANGSDPDTGCGVAQTLTYQWSVRAKPEGATATFSSSANANPSFSADKRGSYELGVLATDGSGRSSPAGVVTVNVDAPCSKPVLSNLRFTAAGQTTAFKGDRIDLAVDATPGNCGPISSQLTYNWTLLAPAGSAAALTSSSSAAPSFIADVAGGNFTVSVTVTDAEGNASNAATLTISVSTCGSSPILAAISDTAGLRPFDDHTFQAVPAAGRTTFSDDDTSGCPARFVGQYSFTWKVVSSAPSVGYAFNNTDGSTVKFTPGGNAVYSVRLVVRSPTKSAEFMTLVGVSCPDVVPKAGTLFIASSTPGYPGKVFLGDTAMLAATPSSLCYSDGSTPYSYLWSLQSLSGGAATLSSVTAAQPTFTVDVADSTWQATVIVVDKLGNRSDPTKGTAAFKSETCGINPVVTTFSDTRAGVSPFAAFDPHDLQATAVSTDDNVAICPARFKNTYAFSIVRVTPPTGKTKWTFVPSSSSAGRFEAGENGTYVVSVDATGSKSGLTGSASLSIAVNCANSTPAATAPAITLVSDPEGITVGGKIFRDETVTVATTPSAACYTGSNFHPSYQWSFVQPDTTDLLATFSSTTAAAPTFVVNESGAIYHVQVQVSDQWGNAAASTSSTFVAENCGKNPVLVSATAAQAPGAMLPFDPWTVAPIASSADDDANQCPQPRFPQGYAFTWAVSAPTGATRFALSSAAGPQTVFTEGEPASGVYAVKATATGSKSGLHGNGTASIATATCATPGPTFSSGISITQVTPPLADPYYANNPGKFFKDDLVAIAGPATFACYTSQASAAATYAWSLTTDASPTPAITQATGAPANASFTADQPNRTYHTRVAVEDHWGNSGSHAQDFASAGCGVSPITAAIAAAQAADAKPMDDWTLTAVSTAGSHFSDDSDPLKCPARFAPAYTFAWSLNPVPSGAQPAFSSTSTNPTTFTPAEPRTYGIHLVVSGNGQSAAADHTVDANCGAPIVGTPVVAQVNGAPPSSTIFVGDLVKVATPVTSQCFAHPALSYTYKLLLGATPAVEPFDPNGHAAEPSFVPREFGGTYNVSVTVSDASGQSGSPTASLQINVSSCGSADPTVLDSLAKQHFDAILQGITGTPAASAALTITQSQGSLPQVQVDFGGAPHSVAVPFYLNRQIGVDVTISIPAFCPNVRFTGARLQDPHFELIPANQWEQPAPTTVTGQPLHFSFTPSVGDETDATGTHPGLYFLSIDLEFGSTNEPVRKFVAPSTPIRVRGRCGTNVPFADAVFTPTPAQVGTLIGIDATTSSDADNETLTFLPSSDTSTGCGLQQQLTYAWFLQATPSGSAAQVLPGTGTAQFTFTPDVPGGYDLALHVTDDTAPPAGSRTGTHTFHVAASAGLAFAAAPTSGNTNIPLGDVTVAFTTASGAPCGTCTGTVTLSAGGGPMLGDPLHLSGTGSVTFVGVTFSAAGDYTLTATSDIGGAASSGLINISDSQLVVTVSGTPVAATQTFNVLVEADAGGMRVPLAALVDLRFCLSGAPCGPGPQGAMMSGSIAFTTSIGIAGTYTIVARAPGATAGTSAPFTVLPVGP